MASIVASIKEKVGKLNPAAAAAPPAQPSLLPTALLQQIDESTTLSWRQRAIGFGVCFGLGIVMSLMSLVMLWTLQVTSFAVVYTFGSALSLASTAFLMGPCKQLRSMMQSGRWVATTVYLLSMAGTLAAAFTVGGFGGVLLVIALLVVQLLAMVYYCATYVPGGQAFLGRLVGIKG